MSYQVLARKWRPRIFEEMVGQEHVLRALINGLDNDRLHHAFLFTGTRGVGKTTIARIFSKALNCEEGVSSKPCGVCSSCKEIDEGRFIDLIEVDAASRTKVEDTRELLENVQYAPTRGRYKVYLIDEVHMLSGHSFNALLKTLEEPPPHVKFLLATTDPQKLPVTILSRCLQFNLKRLSVGMIGDHIRHILDQEIISYEQAATDHLARAADGSMRDALSLVDQGIAFGAGKLETEDVRAMLGSIEGGQVVQLLRDLIAGDAAALMTTISQIADLTPDFSGLLADILVLLQRVALVQAVPDSADEQWEERDAVVDLAAQVSAEDIQLWYQIGLIGRRDLPLAPEPQGGLEMVMLRMLAFRPDTDSATRPATATTKPATKPAIIPAATTKPVTQSAPVANAAPLSPQVNEEPAPASAETANNGADWQTMIVKMNLRAMVKQLANNAVLIGKHGNTVTLRLSQQGQGLRTDTNEQQLTGSLTEYYGEKIKLELLAADAPVPETAEPMATPAEITAEAAAERQKAAEHSIASDPNVQSLEQRLGAKLIPNTIKPE